MNKIKTGDQVIVIAGKDKGKQGSVTKILSNGRCFVSGVQMVKRHTKPNPNAGCCLCSCNSLSKSCSKPYGNADSRSKKCFDIKK